MLFISQVINILLLRKLELYIYIYINSGMLGYIFIVKLIQFSFILIKITSSYFTSCISLMVYMRNIIRNKITAIIYNSDYIYQNAEGKNENIRARDINYL